MKKEFKEFEEYKEGRGSNGVMLWKKRIVAFLARLRPKRSTLYEQSTPP